VFATQDWHPARHGSFVEQGGPWPEHCVQGTHGAELHASLDRSHIEAVVRKGTDPVVDAYSGFLDSDLEKQLNALGTRRVYVGGLATDYCVKHTVLDALRLGFATFVVTDACRAVDVAAGDGDAALAEVRSAGATLLRSTEID
jgi:nicotinamidase/pyrazinamidase